MHLVVFELAGRACAIELARVLEVVPLAPLTPVPVSEPAVIGAAHVKGRVVAALDLALLVGGASSRPRTGDASLLVQTDGVELLLRVDRVREVLSISPAQAGAAAAAPPQVPASGHGAFGPLIATDSGLLQLVDIEAVVAQIARSIDGDVAGAATPLMRPDGDPHRAPCPSSGPGLVASRTGSDSASAPASASTPPSDPDSRPASGSPHASGSASGLGPGPGPSHPQQEGDS